jgi:hypothetical protein
MQNHGVRLMRLFCSLMGVLLVMLPRLHCEQRLMLNRWSQILLSARGFAFSPCYGRLAAAGRFRAKPRWRAKTLIFRGSAHPVMTP